MQELIAHIEQEMAVQGDKDPMINKIGEYVLSLLPKIKEETAAKIVEENKTIQGSIAKMKSEARKAAVNGCAMISDEDGYKIVREYYGIDIGVTPGIINLSDFL